MKDTSKCVNCGEEYGKHNAFSDACPETEAKDQDWTETSFELAENDEVVICENGCTPRDMYGNRVDTPFVYDAYTCSMVMLLPESEMYELGVLAYEDGQPSNRWEDGVAGIPEELYRELRDYSELPMCVKCGGQAKHATLKEAAKLRREAELGF